MASIAKSIITGLVKGAVQNTAKKQQNNNSGGGNRGSAGAFLGSLFGGGSGSGGGQSLGSWQRESAAYVSPYDADLAHANPAFDAGLRKAKESYARAAAAGDTQGMQRANSYLEQLRLSHGGYVAGGDGSGYSVMRPYQNGAAATQQLQGQTETRARDYYGALARQGRARLEGSRRGINQGYDEAARQAYIGHQKQQEALPEQLAQLGLTGGAAESSNLRMTAAYQEQQGRVSSERQNAMNELDLAIVQLQNSTDEKEAAYLLQSAEQMIGRHWQAAQEDIRRSDTQSQNAWQRDQSLAQLQQNKEQQAFSRAQTLLKMGMSSDEIASALGITPAEAARYAQLIQWQLIAK